MNDQMIIAELDYYINRYASFISYNNKDILLIKLISYKINLIIKQLLFSIIDLVFLERKHIKYLILFFYFECYQIRNSCRRKQRYKFILK